MSTLLAAPAQDADLERRFGALRRLYGDAGYARVRACAVAVIGLGGVGSWAAEALARSGVARLVLVDLDHVAESNINRQVQALGDTLGMSKVQALRQRCHAIHPGCEIIGVEEFVTAVNWPGLLGAGASVDAVIDACDQSVAKATLAAWSLRSGVPLVCVGAAGGKRLAQRVEVEDLADTTHDPLLAGLRQRLRKAGLAPRQGCIGVRCVFSRESVAPPAQACDSAGSRDSSKDGRSKDDSGKDGSGRDSSHDGTLNCHGYGSSVTVTATFGMVAAGEVLAGVVARSGTKGSLGTAARI